MSVNVTLVETGVSEARARYRMMSESFVAAPHAAAKSAAKLILEALRQNAPKKTTRLERELDFVLAKLGTGYVARFYGPFYVKWVLEGRGEVWAGIYTGKSTKKFLKFEIDGRTIFTKHVRPARPNDFRIPAMAEVRPALELLMHEVGVRTLRGETAAFNLWSQA